MTRTAPLRRRTRLRAVGAKTRLRRARLAAVTDALWARALGRCENGLCRRRGRLDRHHVVKRSRGAAGRDTLDNLVLLCAGPGRCHDRTDWPWVKGRLCVLVVEGRVRSAVCFSEAQYEQFRAAVHGAETAMARES